VKRRSADVINVPEAGRRLGVSRAKAYELARCGKLPVLRLGRCLRVPVARFEAMLAGTAVGPNFVPNRTLGRQTSELGTES
jgi:excisionase family DNA binding protein